MASMWQSGRESGLLDDIIAGRKTIEGRLNRDKFARYQPGDTISLRRDYRDEDGILRDGELDAARVKVVAVEHYPSFMAMVEAVGYKNVIPSASSAQEAADEYNRFYTKAAQEQYGVLGIHIEKV